MFLRACTTGDFWFCQPSCSQVSGVFVFHNKQRVAFMHLLVFHAVWGLCIALQLGQDEIRALRRDS